MHTHTHTHTPSHTCTHAHMHTHALTHMHTRSHTCTHNTHMHTLTHMHTGSHTCTHKHTRTHMNTHAHTCTHTHTCIHTHMHTHSHTHMHTRMHSHTHTGILQDTAGMSTFTDGRSPRGASVGTGGGPGREPDGSGSRRPPYPPRKSLWSAGPATQAALEEGAPSGSPGAPPPRAHRGLLWGDTGGRGPFTSGIPE